MGVLAGPKQGNLTWTEKLFETVPEYRGGISLFVGISSIHIHIPWAQSLKDKRQVVKSITSRLKNKMNVSVAEVESQDLWQYSVLGVATVSSSEEIARQTLERVLEFVEQNSDVEVVKYNIQLV